MERCEMGTAPEALNREMANVSAVIDWDKEMSEIEKVEEVDATMKRDEEEAERLTDFMVCDSNARMVAGGFSRSDCAGDLNRFTS